MRTLRRHLGVWVLLIACVQTAAHAQGAMVGILEGKATLIRQAGKFALAEGVALQNEDIIDTPAASFVQVEFADGSRIGIGGGTRLMLAPRLQGRAVPRLYLMQGWVKLNQATDKPAPGDCVTPQFEVSAVSGAAITLLGPKELALFVENGSATLTERNNSRPPLVLPAGAFTSAKLGEKPNPSTRPATAFLEQLPRPFRDPLPNRAGRYRDNPVAPKLLGDVAYDDVAVWLAAEPGLRMPLVERWRPRVRDKAFRAAMIANLAAHPEWDPYVFPEKAAKKRAEEKRAREAKAAAAAAAVAAAASASASARASAASAPRAAD